MVRNGPHVWRSIFEGELLLPLMLIKRGVCILDGQAFFYHFGRVRNVVVEGGGLACKLNAGNLQVCTTVVAFHSIQMKQRALDAFLREGAS